jgi:OOP family OmpA-OmpF porin
MKMIKKFNLKTLLLFMTMGFLTQGVMGQRISTDKVLKDWSITVHGGVTTPMTDIRSYDWRRVKGEYQYGVGGSVTKMFGGVFGLQADYMFGNLKGVTVERGGFKEDRFFWKKLGFKEPVYFETKLHNPTLNVYMNFSNMFFGLNRYIRANIKQKEVKERRVSIYGKMGIGALFFDSQVYSVKDDAPYDVNKGDDDPNGKYLVTYSNKAVEVTAPFALGAKFKITKAFDIGIEGRFNYVHTDKLDGHVSNEYVRGRNDKFAYTNVNFTYKFAGKKSQKEHLEWVNPLEAYMNLTDAKLANLYTVKDADKDGVIDELDEEPETPEGTPVDTHGVTLDSDKDGLPDNKDPEPFSTPELPIVDGVNVRSGDKLTPAMIQQVKDIVKAESKNSIGWALNMIFYDLDKDLIRTDAIPELYEVATIMKKYPDLKVNVKGHTDIRNTDPYNMDLSNRRVNAAINYLVNTYGISRDRFVPGFYGEADNLFKNASKEAQHQLNRRVEFTPANY